MVVTIGHVYNTNRVICDRWKGPSHRNTLNIINSNFIVFAPMLAAGKFFWSIITQYGPDCPKFLLLTADDVAQTQYGFSLDDVNTAMV